MTRRHLLTEDERRVLFGIPTDPASLAKFYTILPEDRLLIEVKRSDANRLGFAVQLALLRYPGFGFGHDQVMDSELIRYVAKQLDLPEAAFSAYAARTKTRLEHGWEAAKALRLRPFDGADLPYALDLAQTAAASTDRGLPIATAIVDGLRDSRIILPAPARIERIGVAGRARARKLAADTLVGALTPEQVEALDRLFVSNPATGVTPLAWLRDTGDSPSARASQKRRYEATGKDVGRLMRLFGSTINALLVAHEDELDPWEVLDTTVGWHRLLRAAPQVQAIADLAQEEPLLRASDKYMTLRRFAPAFLEAFNFKSAGNPDPVLSAVDLLRNLNASGKREIPADAPLPFRKNWKAAITKGGTIDRRLYETATMASLRERLESGDIWVEGTRDHLRFEGYLLPREKASEVAPRCPSTPMPRPILKAGHGCSNGGFAALPAPSNAAVSKA